MAEDVRDAGSTSCAAAGAAAGVLTVFALHGVGVSGVGYQSLSFSSQPGDTPGDTVTKLSLRLTKVAGAGFVGAAGGEGMLIDHEMRDAPEC